MDNVKDKALCFEFQPFIYLLSKSKGPETEDYSNVLWTLDLKLNSRGLQGL